MSQRKEEDLPYNYDDEWLGQMVRPEIQPPTDTEALFNLAAEHAKILEELPFDRDYLNNLEPFIIGRNQHGAMVVGEADWEMIPDEVIKNLLKSPSYSRKIAGTLRSLDEKHVITADYCALLFRDLTPSRNWDKLQAWFEFERLLDKHEDLFAKADFGMHPGLFSFGTTFDSALHDWDDVIRNPDELAGAGEEAHIEMMYEFITLGMGVLTEETQDKYIRQVMARFNHLYTNGGLQISLVYNANDHLGHRGFLDQRAAYLPSEKGMTFIPVVEDKQRSPKAIGQLIISIAWLHSVYTNPNQALAYLLRSASFARDCSYGKLVGNQWVHGTEVSVFDKAVQRADDIVRRFLDEVEEYDHKKLAMPLNIDQYCSTTQRLAFTYSHYDNPADFTG